MPRYIGHPDGVELSVPVGSGYEFKDLFVPYDGELPQEIGGQKVTEEYKTSLLEQADNWTETPVAKQPSKKGGE